MSSAPNMRQRRLACENRLFEVFFEEVTDQEGVVVPDYLVVSPRKKTENLVTGVAILPIVNGKFALLRIYRHILKAYTWEVPRGFVEGGEENSESVVRELKEETGLECPTGRIESLGLFAPEAGILAARIHLFVARECRWSAPFKVNELGHQELRLIDKQEFESMEHASLIEDPSTLISYYRYVHGR